MLATDAKTEPDLFFLFFYDKRKFQRQCVNVIDTTWGDIYYIHHLLKFWTRISENFSVQDL